MKKRILIGVAILCGLSYSYASGLTQSQFDVSVKKLYNDIELSQTRLHQSVDSNQSQLLIVQRACEYANSLNALAKFAKENSHISKAKDEENFAQSMRSSFEQSFKDLGTSYQKSC